jgi:hypothetical protein
MLILGDPLLIEFMYSWPIEKKEKGIDLSMSSLAKETCQLSSTRITFFLVLKCRTNEARKELLERRSHSYA